MTNGVVEYANNELGVIRYGFVLGGIERYGLHTRECAEFYYSELTKSLPERFSMEQLADAERKVREKWIGKWTIRHDRYWTIRRLGVEFWSDEDFTSFSLSLWWWELTIWRDKR